MKYVLKIGDSYLTSDGVLTSNQSEALRLIDIPAAKSIRVVKLAPHGSRAGSVDSASDDAPSTDLFDLRS